MQGHFNLINLCLVLLFSLCGQTQPKRPVLTLPIGHQQAVHSIDFSKDGNLIVTGALDNTFILWDAKTGFIIRRTIAEGPVQQVLFTPDGSHLITLTGQSEASFYAKQKPIIQKWDVKTGKMLMKFPFSASPGLSFFRDSGYLLVPDYSGDLAARKENMAEKFDITDTDKMLKNFEKMSDPRYTDSLDKAAGKKRKELEKTMGKIDYSDPKKVEEFHRKMLEELMGVDPAAETFERNITIVDLKTLKPVASLKKTPGQIKLVYHNGVEYIVTEHAKFFEKNGNQVVAWKLGEFINQYKEKRLIKAAKEFPVGSNFSKLATSQAKGFIAINAESNGIQLWQIDKPNPVANLKTKGSRLDNLEFSPQGDILYGYSTTGLISFIEAWNTADPGLSFSVSLPWNYYVAGIRLSSSGQYFTANRGFGLMKLSLRGDSLTQFHGHWGMPSYYGLTKNDQEVYVAYNVSPFIAAYVKQGAYYSKPGNEYVKKAFETMIEEEAKAQNKILSKIEKEKLLDERMKSAYSMVTSEAYKGYILAWDLLRGGARFENTDAYQAPHKTKSADNRYELSNERYESAHKEAGKTTAKQMDFIKTSGHFNKDSLEKSLKELQAAGAVGDIPEDFLKDPVGSASQYMDQLKGITSQEAFNGPVTLLINRKTGDTISLIRIDSVDWVMLLKNGYYMTSKNGARSLSYTRGLDVFSFEQFDIQYNRPDLVLKAIGLANPALIDAYKKAWQRRIKRLEIDSASFKQDFNIPRADFDNRSMIDYEQQSGKLKLVITAGDDKANLNRFNVWVNEVPVFGKNGKSLKEGKSKKLQTAVDIVLSPGANRIETSVINDNGVESYREPLYVSYKPVKPEEEKVYFIGIGINRFADSRRNLSWSVKDIRDLAIKMKERYGNNISIDTLFDENVTIEKIKLFKDRLNEFHENDKVILAYSGHGLLSKQYDYYLSTYNVNFKKPEENGLPYEELESLLDNIRPRKKLLLIDACNSGEVDKETMQEMKRKADALRLVINTTARDAGEETIGDEGQLGLKNSFELMQELFANVGRSTGATVIAAAAGTQFALEKNELSNGAFTSSILEAMQQHKTLKVSQLKQIVRKRVPELTGGMQQPTFRSEPQQTDWYIW